MHPTDGWLGVQASNPVDMPKLVLHRGVVARGVWRLGTTAGKRQYQGAMFRMGRLRRQMSPWAYTVAVKQLDAEIRSVMTDPERYEHAMDGPRES